MDRNVDISRFCDAPSVPRAVLIELMAVSMLASEAVAFDWVSTPTAESASPDCVTSTRSTTIVSLASTPTCSVMVPPLFVEEADAVEARRLGDPVDLGDELLELGVEHRPVVGGERSVRRLDGELPHPAEAVADLVQSCFGGLNERNAVLGVPPGGAERADARAHPLRDGESGGIVGRGGDPESGRQSPVVPPPVER